MLIDLQRILNWIGVYIISIYKLHLVADGLEVEEPLVLVDGEEGEVGEDEGEGPRAEQDHAVAVAGRGGQLEPPLNLGKMLNQHKI